jgi:argininosuccinate synthase
MPIVEMIESLEIIGGTHGVGRTDTPAGSGDGTACREIGEAPAAALLQLAQRELRSLRLAPDVAARVEESGRAYAQLIQSGAWFSPARQTIDAFISSLQPALSGSIRLRLFKGDCTVSTLVAS